MIWVLTTGFPFSDSLGFRREWTEKIHDNLCSKCSQMPKTVHLWLATFGKSVKYSQNAYNCCDDERKEEKSLIYVDFHCFKLQFKKFSNTDLFWQVKFRFNGNVHNKTNMKVLYLLKLRTK